MVMICLHAKFHIPSSSGSLVTSIKPKAKYRIDSASILLFYIFRKKKLNKSFMFFEDLFSYIILGPCVQ